MPRVNRREIFADAEIQVFQATLMRTNSTSHLDRMFDNLGRVLTASNSGTTNIPTTVQTNVYDANSRRTQQTATVSSVADYKNTWTWDNANRQTQVKQEGQTGGITVAAKRVDFTYNTGGLFTGVKRYNDLAGTQIVANTTYTYDQLARLTALDHKNASGGNLANYTWTFDNDRRITNFTNVDGYSSYTYDSNDQVTVVDHSYQTDETYTYDANGNRTNTGYTTGTNNRVTSDGTYNYTYDNEGNRTSRTKISDSTKVEYTWDHRNRLTDVVFKTSGGTVTKKVQHQYDVFDRRIGKKIDADGNGTYESATYWVYDDAGKRDPNTRTSLDDIVLEFNDADGDGTGLATLTTRYLHGPQFDQVLASEASSGNVVTWALADHQGTVRDLARYASGTTTVVNHRKFDAFGNLTAESDATVKFLYSYTGREWDGDAGLYYYRARWYDAKIGRFISEDPSGFRAGDTNLNRYVRNSTLNGTDPTGLQDGLEVRLNIANRLALEEILRNQAPQGHPPVGPDRQTLIDLVQNNPAARDELDRLFHAIDQAILHTPIVGDGGPCGTFAQQLAVDLAHTFPITRESPTTRAIYLSWQTQFYAVHPPTLSVDYHQMYTMTLQMPGREPYIFYVDAGTHLDGDGTGNLGGDDQIYTGDLPGTLYPTDGIPSNDVSYLTRLYNSTIGWVFSTEGPMGLHGDPSMGSVP